MLFLRLFSVFQMLQYRKAIANFQAIAAERANTQIESSLQMELLNRIAQSQRGLSSTRNDRAAILDLIERLENAYTLPSSSGSNAGAHGTSGKNLAAEAASTAAVAKAATAAATAVDSLIDGSSSSDSVEGVWHLEYVSNSEEDIGGWDFAGSTDPEKTERVRSFCQERLQRVQVEGQMVCCSHFLNALLLLVVVVVILFPIL